LQKNLNGRGGSSEKDLGTEEGAIRGEAVARKVNVPSRVVAVEGIDVDIDLDVGILHVTVI